MWITRPTDWMDRDTRWKAWGKLVRGSGDLDLGKKNGYSITGPWVSWDEAVSLTEGSYLVVAAEIGSRKNREYCYGLIAQSGANEDPEWILASRSWNESCPAGQEKPDIMEALTEVDATDEQRARAANSPLYAMALWMAAQYRESQNDPCEDPIPEISTEDLIKSLIARGYSIS